MPENTLARRSSRGVMMSLELFMKDEIVQKPQQRMKVCTKCKTPKPATREYFHSDGKGGVRAHCRECRSVANKIHTFDKTKSAYKICTGCNIPKPATADYFRRKLENKRHGLTSRCKECLNKADRHYMKNGGYERKHDVSAHRNALNALRYRVTKRGKCKFLLGEAGTPEAEAYIAYLQTLTHCPDCDKKLLWYARGKNNPDSASFDRIDSNGHYTKENVRVVCISCNSQKSNSPVDEWVGLLEVRVRKGILKDVDSRLTEYIRRQGTLDGFFDRGE